MKSECSITTKIKINIYENALKKVDDLKLQELIKVIGNKVEKPLNGDNKKVIIFTAFADTADYLYKNLSEEMLKLGIYTACVTGKSVVTNNRFVDKDFNSVLCAFSPISKMKKEIPANEQIDLLIGTDCISEGQNLQDCDFLINYDIH